MAKSRANATATLKTKRPKSPTKRSSATAVQADTPPPTATFDPNFGSPGSVEVHYAGPIEPPSPPSSVDEHHDDGEKVMGVASPILSSSDEEHDHHHNGVAEMISSVEHQNLPPYSLPDCMSQSHYEPGDADYDYDGPVSSMDDPEGEWESDSGPGASFHERKRHGGSDSTNSSASPETISRARKSVTPTSSGKMFQRPPHLSPSSTARRQTGNYFTSRASSANYSDIGMEERKTPLVLLHMSLLLLPGAEEPILRKITPTMLQRGLLIEHPRSDYQLLEELIFDALGLDEPYNLDDDKDEAGSEEDENDLSDTAAWEKSMGIRRIEGRDKWELRIYASNGLMTAGAWRKVWNDMERIDVEIGPRDWRTRKTGNLLRDFAELSGGHIRNSGTVAGDFGEDEMNEPLDPEEAEPTFQHPHQILTGERIDFAKLLEWPTTVEARTRWVAVALLIALLLTAIGSSISSAMSRSFGRNEYKYTYPVFSARTERYMDQIDRYAAAAKDKDGDNYVRVIMMNPEPTKISTTTAGLSGSRIPEIREPADLNVDIPEQSVADRGKTASDSGLAPEVNAGCAPVNDQSKLSRTMSQTSPDWILPSLPAPTCINPIHLPTGGLSECVNDEEDEFERHNTPFLTSAPPSPPASLFSWLTPWGKK